MDKNFGTQKNNHLNILKLKTKNHQNKKTNARSNK